MSSSEEEPEPTLPSVTELELWLKRDLQDWLHKRGLPKTGDKKKLAERIYRAITAGESDVSDDDEDDNDEEEMTALDPAAWVTLTENNVPNITEEDVNNYFLYRRNNLGVQRSCHRQLIKAKRFSNERYIGEIELNHSGNIFSHVRAKCRPSMRTTVFVGPKNAPAKYYSLNIAIIRTTGKVDSRFTTCNCKAGSSGVCSHIGGTLLTLVKIKNACTTQSCRWIEPPELVGQREPLRLQDISMLNTAKESTREPVQKPYPEVFNPSKCADTNMCSGTFLEDLLDGLATTAPHSRLYKTLRCSSANVADIVDLYTPNFSFADHCELQSEICQDEFENFVTNLHVTPEQADKLLQGTIGQANNRNWKEIRTYILPSSLFGGIFSIIMILY